MKYLLKIVLPIVSLPFLSRIWGRIVRIRHPRFLVKRIIERYRKAYGIDMTEYEGQVGDYSSLVDFFIRKLEPAQRPLKPNPSAVVSPADGVLSIIDTVYEDRTLQVKGKHYSVTELVKEELTLPCAGGMGRVDFDGGYAAVLRQKEVEGY